MATTNVTNTTLFNFRGGAGGATVVARQNDVTFSVNHEPRDITTKDEGQWRTLLEGPCSYEISISGLVAFDDALSPFTATTGLIAKMLARTSQTWVLGTGVSGDVKLSGAGYWSSVEIGSPDRESNMTYSGTLQGSGIFYQGTF